MLSTLNNLQDLDVEYLEATVPVQWTRVLETDKAQYGITSVPVLVLLKDEVVVRKTANIRQ